MVIESLMGPLKAKKKPWDMFFIGIVYSSMAVLFSLFIFREYASMIMIFFTVMASVPLMYRAVKVEEKIDLKFQEEKFLIKEHGKALSFFMCLFVGFMVSFSLWYIFLPADISNDLFSIQVKEIAKAENVITGNAISMIRVFSIIFFNNLMVMLFSLLFSLFYGVGSIFILTWNASIIGAAIGMFVKGASHINYFASIPVGVLRYSIHGLPEMLAYFMAGLAGGIISVAVIRHDFGSGKFRRILLDSFDLVLLSIVVLFISSLIEVFVTPVLF